MEIRMEAYRALPCELEVFEINGRIADKDDFGQSEDVNRAAAQPYGCGDRQFIPAESISEEVLNEYGISEAEAREIQSRLESELYVGSCGWCV